MKSKTLPVLVGLASTLGMVAVTFGAPVTYNMSIDAVSNIAVSCTPGSLENCALYDFPKLQCGPGLEPVSMSVTINQAAMRTRVEATNSSGFSACLNIVNVNHTALTVAIPAASLTVNGGAGNNDGTGVTEPPNFCTTNWIAPGDPDAEIFKFFRAAGGTINKANIVQTLKGPLGPTVYTPASANWGVFYGAGNFRVNLSGSASQDSQAAGTWDGGVRTGMTGSVTLDLTCRVPPEPKLFCDGKTINGTTQTTIDQPNATLPATFRIRTADNENPLNVNIVDTMGAKMSYVAGSANPVESSNPPLRWNNVPFPADTTINSSPAGDAVLDATYQIQVTGLEEGETVCNSVVATSGSLTTANQTCRACVTRQVEEEVPAIGALGTGALALGLSGLGLLLGFRRRS